MLRHQLAYKLPIFKGRLDAYLGLEGRYHTAYYADGYSPFYNQFYYQDNILVSNRPELSAFFNFKVKRLRAFVTGDQLQQLFWTKNVMQAPGYPAPNVYLRLGFNWVMMN
ncbi:putative porin [compost metagenome]